MTYLPNQLENHISPPLMPPQPAIRIDLPNRNPIQLPPQPQQQQHLNLLQHLNVHQMPQQQPAPVIQQPQSQTYVYNQPQQQFVPNQSHQQFITNQQPQPFLQNQLLQQQYITPQPPIPQAPHVYRYTARRNNPTTNTSTAAISQPRFTPIPNLTSCNSTTCQSTPIVGLRPGIREQVTVPQRPNQQVQNQIHTSNQAQQQTQQNPRYVLVNNQQNHATHRNQQSTPTRLPSNLNNQQSDSSTRPANNPTPVSVSSTTFATPTVKKGCDAEVQVTIETRNKASQYNRPVEMMNKKAQAYIPGMDQETQTETPHYVDRACSPIIFPPSSYEGDTKTIQSTSNTSTEDSEKVIQISGPPRHVRKKVTAKRKRPEERVEPITIQHDSNSDSEINVIE